MYSESVVEHWGFPPGCLIERGAHVLQVKPRDGVETPAMFQEPVGRAYVALKGLSEYPAVLISRYGEGKVIYFPEALGAFFGTTRMPTAEERLVRAVQMLHPEPLVNVDAPPTVIVEAYRLAESGYMTIHLVNNTVDGYPVKSFLPVSDVMVQVRLDKKPGRVYQLREQGAVETRYDKGVASIRLGRLERYEVLVIE